MGFQWTEEGEEKCGTVHIFLFSRLLTRDNRPAESCAQLIILGYHIISHFDPLTVTVHRSQTLNDIIHTLKCCTSEGEQQETTALVPQWPKIMKSIAYSPRIDSTV